MCGKIYEKNKQVLNHVAVHHNKINVILKSKGLGELPPTNDPATSLSTTCDLPKTYNVPPPQWMPNVSYPAMHRYGRPPTYPIYKLNGSVPDVSRGDMGSNSEEDNNSELPTRDNELVTPPREGVIIEVKNIPIRDKDLLKLREKEWLNDELINFYLQVFIICYLIFRI